MVGEAPDDRARQDGHHLLRVAAALKVTGSRSGGSAWSAGSWRSAGSHQSAARVYQLGIVGLGPAPLIQVTRAPGNRGSRTGRPGVRVHVAALPAEHVVSYRGVPLTSVPRTVIDLARTLPFGEAVAVADSALHARLTSKTELAAVICAVLALAWPAAGPRGNRVQRRPVRIGAGVPQPGRVSARPVSRHQTCRSGSATTARSSAGPTSSGGSYNTIGEADGAFKYQTPARARTQLERDARLRAAGYEVVHFTWPQITRAPAQVIDTIRVAFSRGSLLGSPGRRGEP